jgi:membrane protease YdiL (CAAX protease family)
VIGYFSSRGQREAEIATIRPRQQGGIINELPDIHQQINTQPLTEPPRHAPVASFRNLVIVVLLLICMGSISFYSQHWMPHRFLPRRITVYLTAISSEWLMVTIAISGIRARGLQVRRFIAPNWDGLALLNDFGIALGFQIVAGIIAVFALRTLLSTLAPINPILRQYAPRGHLETVLFLMLALTAGFCEEFLFRGYLQLQFTALSQNPIVGTAMQVFLFGAMHAYQGVRRMAIVTCYGALLTLLALWRRSLRPGMIAHFMQDAFAGLVASAR